MLSRAYVSVLCLAVAASGSLVLHDSRPTPPHGFVHHGAAPTHQMLTLRVGLASANISGLEATLQRISNPASPEYGQWLTADQVKAYVAPRASTLAAFQAFADANGLSVSPATETSEWVELTTTVARANVLFGASYQTYEHASTGAVLTRTLSYSLPVELVGHVDTVTPTTGFEVHSGFARKSRSLGQHSVVPSQCDTSKPNGHITPKCLQDMYEIPSQPAKFKNTSLLVTAYDFFAQQADLSAFLKLERPDMNPNTTFTFASLDNGTNPQSPADAVVHVEANLDIQYTVGLATGVNTTFLSVGGNYTTDLSSFVTAFLDTVSYLQTVPHPPGVVTTSYGDNEEYFARADAKKFCDGYMALTARGVSVLFASGDGGVRGSHDVSSQCTNNTFIPVFPTTCPYVTSVGSTFGWPEVAVNFSSGGFSNYFARPWYQDAIVPAFLATVPASFPGVFNRSGRGFPDVATQGLNFEYINGGELGLISGTSASSPTFASVIALINDELAQAGKKPMGFLNPFLYLLAGPAGVFNDVTSGKNVGISCNNTASGFTAGKGWDPVTGFGTPNYRKLLLAAGIKSVF